MSAMLCLVFSHFHFCVYGLMFFLTDWGLVFLSCLSSDSSQFSASAPAQVLDESAVSV